MNGDLRQSLIEHMERTRQCYIKRDIEGYLAGFADSYISFQLNGEFFENKDSLREKMLREFERYDLLSMDFEVVQIHFSDKMGYAQLRYISKLKPVTPMSNQHRILIDKRENLIVARREADGGWLIEAKIVLNAENYYEPLPGH